MGHAHGVLLYAFLVGAALLAGIQNALAGGGSFLTFPALLLFGMGARAANITSTVALFPGQIATGLAGRALVSGAEGLSFRTLTVISLVGGAVGRRALLLATPESFFQRLVPFLVLFATALSFAWGSFFRREAEKDGHALVQPGCGGGAVSDRHLRRLFRRRDRHADAGGADTGRSVPVRQAGATKNVLAGVMNASAVLIFAFSPDVHWAAAGAVAAGAVVGGQIGAWLMIRVNERALRVGVVGLGLVLTAALFGQAYL